MEKKIDEERFRANFRNIDDTVMLGYEHLAALTGTTLAAIRQAGSKRKLPQPAIQSNKLVRWTAGQIRGWLNELAMDAARRAAEIAIESEKLEQVAESAPGRKAVRIGRPRTPDTEFGINSKPPVVANTDQHHSGGDQCLETRRGKSSGQFERH